MIKRRLLAVLSAVSLAGCITPSDPVYVLVKTDPEGATVTFTDGTTCQTPCRLGIVDPVLMTVARIGYDPVVQRVDRLTPSPLYIEMTPVGRSVDVEEVELPDL